MGEKETVERFNPYRTRQTKFVCRNFEFGTHGSVGRERQVACIEAASIAPSPELPSLIFAIELSSNATSNGNSCNFSKNPSIIRFNFRESSNLIFSWMCSSNSASCQNH
jgi:hypothetical protein